MVELKHPALAGWRVMVGKKRAMIFQNRGASQRRHLVQKYEFDQESERDRFQRELKYLIENRNLPGIPREARKKTGFARKTGEKGKYGTEHKETLKLSRRIKKGGGRLHWRTIEAIQNYLEACPSIDPDSVDWDVIENIAVDEDEQRVWNHVKGLCGQFESGSWQYYDETNGAGEIGISESGALEWTERLKGRLGAQYSDWEQKGILPQVPQGSWSEADVIERISETKEYMSNPFDPFSLPFWLSKHPKKYRKLTPKEQDDVKARFGGKLKCSFAYVDGLLGTPGKRKHYRGYFCFTHRAWCTPRPSIDRIRQQEYKFISSTA